MNADSSFQERNAPSEFGNIGSDDFRMADESLVYFNLFGLQRTGTNLATLSLIRNFHIAFAPRGQEWKHGRVLNAERTHNGQPVNFLLCVKNPYAWLVSCYRYFQRHHCSDVSVAPQFRADPGILFEAFVRTPTYQFETPIHRWNERYAHWINELPINRTHIVRHEDQLTRPQQVLHEIQAKFSLVPKEVPFVTEDRHVCVDMRLGHSMDFGYYTNHEYMHDFTPALVDFVNTTLDWDLMSHFRYIPLRSSESTRANPTNVSAAKHGYQLSVGDAWTLTAIDAGKKLSYAYMFGMRKARQAHEFTRDVASPIARKVQLTTDALKVYLDAVDDVVGGDVDFAQLIEIYGPDNSGPGRHSPPT